MITGEPTFKLELRFSCRCTETWMTYNQLQEPIRTIDVPCPSDCPACLRDGLCPTRKTMAPAFTPIDFSDIAAGGPKKYRRMAASQ